MGTVQPRMLALSGRRRNLPKPAGGQLQEESEDAEHIRTCMGKALGDD